jgi:hypothetical protein
VTEGGLHNARFYRTIAHQRFSLPTCTARTRVTRLSHHPRRRLKLNQELADFPGTSSVTEILVMASAGHRERSVRNAVKRSETRCFCAGAGSEREREPSRPACGHSDMYGCTSHAKIGKISQTLLISKMYSTVLLYRWLGTVQLATRE